MNVSESGLAELYRNLGREVPEGLTVDSPAVAPRKEKYGRVKKEVDGIVFDSTLEAEAYKILKLWSLAGEISNLNRQPVFVLHEAFRDESGKHHRAVKYVADFFYLKLSVWVGSHNLAVETITRDVKRVVIDAKGIKTPAFRLKEKLFRAKYPDIDLQIWDRDKVKELSHSR